MGEYNFVRGPPSVSLAWEMFEALGLSDHWSKVLDYYFTLPEVDQFASEPIEGFTRIFGAVSVLYRYGLDLQPDQTFQFHLVPEDVLQFWREIMDRNVPLFQEPPE